MSTTTMQSAAVMGKAAAVIYTAAIVFGQDTNHSSNNTVLSRYENSEKYEQTRTEWRRVEYLISEYRANRYDETVEIGGFQIEEHNYNINPPLRFLCEFDRESGLFQVYGVGLYEDILAYGETVDDARDMLENEIVPFLWKECVREDELMLSQRVMLIKADLGGRIEA